MVVNNPNNWHWVDKNCIDWSKKYFNEKLVGLQAEENDKEVHVSSVKSVEGDVEVCQRKGKVISIFDLRLVVEISGFYVSKSKEEGPFSGSITIPELAYDTTGDEIQFDINIYNENSDSEKMRTLVKQKLLPQVRERLSIFGHDLITTHSNDIQLSSEQVNSAFTKANQESSTKTPTNTSSKSEVASSASKASTQPQKSTLSTSSSLTSFVPKYNTTTLHLEPAFNTSAEQLYITLLDRNRIGAWTRSNPVIEAFPPPVGSEFKIFDGAISGRILSLTPNEHISQAWRLLDWKDGHYAQLDILMKQGSSDTTLVVAFSGVPIGEEERVKNNFEDYYIRSIKLTFGFGAVL